ncbi:MAG: CHAT domain-containing protein, partial [Bacteroidota bacterium]
DKIPNDETAVIEYFYDTSSVYSFVLTRQGLRGHRVAFSEHGSQKPRSSKKAIEQLRDFDISNYLSGQQQQTGYVEAQRELYELLVAPLLDDLKDKTELIIVPHGMLNYISFDMLSPNEATTSWKQRNYLIKDFAIQYLWSLAFWNSEPTQQSAYKRDFVGFAPAFAANALADREVNVSDAFRSEWSLLSYSKEEVEEAAQYFNGPKFIASEATESTFQQYASESRIVHLATHAYVNDQFPLQSGLLLASDGEAEDGYLNTFEIYNMKLPAEMAVMSACNTGSGQLAEGEGVISLGRAFSYAGCKSILMSLWMSNDRSTPI